MLFKGTTAVAWTTVQWLKYGSLLHHLTISCCIHTFQRILHILSVLKYRNSFVVTKPEFLTFMAHPYPVSLCLNWKNTFLLLSWLKIQHSGGWHAAQLATSVYSLLNIGWGKHFHPHRLPPAFHEWNWRQSLSSQFSLVKTHRLGTLNTLDCTRLFWKGYLS